MLANLDPSTTQALFTGQLVAALGSILGLAAVVIGIVNSRRTQKREVTITDGLVAKQDFERVMQENRQEHANLFAKIGGVERGSQVRMDERFENLRSNFKGEIDKLNEASEARSVELHERINPINKQMGGVEKETELLNQRMVQMDAKLDRLIERK